MNLYFCMGRFTPVNVKSSQNKSQCNRRQNLMLMLKVMCKSKCLRIVKKIIKREKEKGRSDLIRCQIVP